MLNDVFICDGVRTPIGRYGGSLASIRADDLAALPLQALIERNPKLDLEAVDDVIYGCVNQAGEDNRNVARMALLLAGIPANVPGSTVNRLCASGLDAIGIAARAIHSGEMDLVIAGGVESMSRSPFIIPKADTGYDRTLEMHDSTLGWRFVNPRMRDLYGVDTMPETAENVAAENRISRADQDAFALRSQTRTARAIESGFFDKEIIPVTLPQKKGPPLIFNQDEHPRPATTADQLARLKPITHPNGTITAGNSSGVNDGAAALILASAAAVQKHGLTPRARITSVAAAGVPPRVMGIGPVPSTQRLLTQADLSISDIDVIELNEAFAGQALAVLRQLGLPDDAEHVNPNGGAIALGHPTGMSGIRLVLTAINHMENTALRRAIATMCAGVGQGVSVLVERI
ncbi:3-oxoadipyl-CoA thiolase [Yanghanlia caeni]|uniref:Beta-ketoadipyl-CoA thiolase n=1 Tax=Yanghanlia caeni TaxID=3064283 RepID=A0ABU1D9Q8_9BURK|nr:3-oxoadipyl-CoA thiolase [Alcaligenaceae bacterium LG-2]